MRKIEIKQIDAFTKTPFQGNPAGVVLRTEGLNSRQMQKIAKEMNLSETAFVAKRWNRQLYSVRFFTPEKEVNLCGHATIATFYALAKIREIQPSTPYREVFQKTKAGHLAVRIFFDQGNPKMILMGQAKPRFQPVRINHRVLSKILGIETSSLDLQCSPIEKAFTGLWHLIVPIKSRKSIDLARPNYLELRALNKSLDVTTTHLFTLNSGRKEITAYTRDFAPAAGVDEDPVTGTANGALGAYLVKNRVVPLTFPEVKMTFEQGNRLRRKGILTIEISHHDGMVSEVWVGGEAVTTLEGTIRI
jgi:trans-2,3-dihydro-3-hydroxyanthranilate isomerase